MIRYFLMSSDLILVAHEGSWNVPLKDFSEFLLDSARTSGQTLQQFSRLAKTMKRMFPETAPLFKDLPKKTIWNVPKMYTEQLMINGED